MKKINDFYLKQIERIYKDSGLVNDKKIIFVLKELKNGKFENKNTYQIEDGCYNEDVIFDRIPLSI